MKFFWAVVLLLPAVAAAEDEPTGKYMHDVRPVLQKRCFSCHGALQQKGGLRLDTAQRIRTGGDSGPAVVPNDPAGSLLVEKILEPDASQRMPPEGEPLGEKEIAAIREWITSGAPVPENEQPQKDPRDHWAYRVPVRPPLPAGSAENENPIDAFLDAQRKSRGLTASPPVSKELWLRRVTLDLIGLPPTPADLQTFLADESETAYETVAARLLKNPAHGERWARHWMDVWRYSDWYGLGTELRFSHYHIWRWRDWIVESLNAGKGYDQMVVAMLAGDEVAPEDLDTLRATGFLVRNWDTFSRNKWLDTTVEHTARAFLGVTLQCARCHDHKFDPLAQTEYYQFRAIFEPYQFRIERLPGQPDRNQQGLVRTFDEYLETPTHLFVRGDETTPDKDRVLTAGVPRTLGGTLEIHPVELPVAAYNPDKRPFVIEEAKQSADRTVQGTEQAVTVARAAVGQAESAQAAAELEEKQAEGALATAKPEEQAKTREAAVAAIDKAARARVATLGARRALQVALRKKTIADASRNAVLAVLHVESLEDQGVKATRPEEWVAAAHAALSAQRAQAVLEAESESLALSTQVEQLTATLDALLASVTDPKDESLKPAIAKTSTALVDARVKLTAAEKRRTETQAESVKPLTTDYKPRSLEFPRAKVTYRDTPSNAPYPKISTGRRLGLARWMTDKSNPLTARVAVNHIWTRHFGEPLVTSVFDFGLRTARPIHHELLDWLAVEFMESGWDMKRLHTLICTSRAYRMRSGSTDAEASHRALDPDNHYYWRMNPRRMEAEVIRDSLLQLSGRLDTTMGGPDAPTAAAEEGLRRTIYYRYSRDDRMLFLTMFDAASAEECYRRHETVVPQQALAFMNGKLVFDRAADISRLISKEVGDRPTTDFVTVAFERLLGRKPSAAEWAEATDGVDKLLAVESGDAAGGAAAGSADGTPLERARAAFIHVLLNHNDFVTIR
ncbi:MAG: PSD1 and planctomycete cytochrome C domain-containing protein [Planctomycetota bacterium]|nr:PSD1 and planctomycete cytochrome C domain-containing protein [Planctomycetota bacterium]